MPIAGGVVFAVLCGAVLHAMWNTLVKSSADKQLDSMAVAAGACVLSLLAVPAVGVPSPAAWPWLGASSIVHIAYFTILAAAYQWGDMSFAYPIMRGGGPTVASLASVLVFGEVLASKEAIGVALICAGVLTFATHARHEHGRRWRPLALALLNACIIGMYTILDARGARASGAPVAYAAWFFILSGAAVFTAIFIRRGVAAPEYLVVNARRALLGGACTAGSYGIALWAITVAPVALVATLRETSVVFGAVLAVIFLGERITRRRAIASSAIFGGLVLLRL